MTALVRYLLSDVTRSQRWIGPVLVFLVALLVVTPTTGPVLPTYAVSAGTLLPVAMWLTVVVLHQEGPEQAGITLAAGGGFGRVRSAKLITALGASLGLAAVALAWITVISIREVSAERIGVGAVDFVITAVAGVALGGSIARPVVRRLGWTVLLGALILVAELLIRNAPPVNATLQLYRSDFVDAPVRSTLLVALWTAVLSIVVSWPAFRVARRNS